MHMQSPELLLKDLIRALLELNAATVVLNDEELSNELKEVTRRVILAEVLAENWIIAIGGTQGAGKTTLMLSMYELEGDSSDWLSPNEGRGEQLPVLILEDDSCVSPRGALRELGPLDETKERFGVVERDVDVGEFQAAICNAKTNVVLPVLYVPRTYFKHPGQAFLLLPGYEHEDRDNAIWQQLMRQALVGAAGCLIVTDETRLVGQRETEIVRDLLTNDLPGSHPLVVISKTEGLADNVEQMRELRLRAAEVFQIPANEADRRVHCVGASDPGYKAQWLPRLKEVLYDLAVGGVGARQAQLSRLQDVLEKRLGRVLRLARNRSRIHLSSAAGEDGGGDQVVTRVLEAFDDAKSSLEDDFKAEMRKLVDSHYDAAWKSLEKKLIKEYEGVMPKIRGLRDTVSEKHRRLLSDSESEWQQQGNVLDAFAIHTAELTHSRLGGPKPQVEPAQADSGAFQRLGYVGNDGGITAWRRPTDDDIQNLHIMLGQSSGEAALHSLATKELESTVRLLPALGLEYARLASLMPALVGVDPKSLESLPASDVNAALESVKQQFAQATDISKSVLRGVAMIAAVDVGVDGKIDSLPALINVLTGGASSTVSDDTVTTEGPGTAITMAGAVVGVIAVGYLTHCALQEVRRYDGQVRSIAQQMLASIADHHYAHFLKHFNRLMRELRVHLRQRLKRRYRLDEQLMTQDRLAKALAEVEGGRRELMEQLALSGRSLSIMADSLA